MAEHLELIEFQCFGHFGPLSLYEYVRGSFPSGSYTNSKYIWAIKLNQPNVNLVGTVFQK